MTTRSFGFNLIGAALITFSFGISFVYAETLLPLKKVTIRDKVKNKDVEAVVTETSTKDNVYIHLSVNGEEVGRIRITKNANGFIREGKTLLLDHIDNLSHYEKVGSALNLAMANYSIRHGFENRVELQAQAAHAFHVKNGYTTKYGHHGQQYHIRKAWRDFCLLGSRFPSAKEMRRDRKILELSAKQRSRLKMAGKFTPLQLAHSEFGGGILDLSTLSAEEVNNLEKCHKLLPDILLSGEAFLDESSEDCEKEEFQEYGRKLMTEFFQKELSSEEFKKYWPPVVTLEDKIVNKSKKNFAKIGTRECGGIGGLQLVLEPKKLEEYKKIFRALGLYQEEKSAPQNTSSAVDPNL